jgi:hypothetical protein
LWKFSVWAAAAMALYSSYLLTIFFYFFFVSNFVSAAIFIFFGGPLKKIPQKFGEPIASITKYGAVLLYKIEIKII